MNFLEETIKDIEKSGHTVDDIAFIGSVSTGHGVRDWEHFTQLANFDYDSGYGSAKIAQDLKVVFSDKSYMWREEYDGSEWWSYCVPVDIPEFITPVESLGGNRFMWDTLEDIQARLKDDD